MNFSTSKKMYLSAGVLIVIALFAHRFGWLSPFEKVLSTTIEPFLARSRSLSLNVGNEYAFFKDRSAFFDATRSCFERVQNLTVDQAHLEQLEEENSNLKEQLGFKQTQSSTFRLAQVITEDNAHVEKVIIVNQGAQEGVKVGLPVIAGKGVLVGKVIRVDEHTSQVRLVSDSLSRVEAALLNHDQTIGVVEGGFGISLQMKFVPRSEIIRVNEHIITSGREPLVPRGLVLGTVTTVENEAYQGFQRVTLTPSADLSKLSFVSIILPP